MLPEEKKKHRLRRLATAKRKERYRRYVYATYDIEWYILNGHTDWLEREINFFESSPRCSCLCCGNPRRHFNTKTKQELVMEERFEASLRELV